LRLFNLDLAALALLTGVIPMGAAAAESAQDYPERPIKLVSGAPPGAEGAMLAHLIAEHMGQDLGQRLIVEHKPGAAHNIAGEAVARSKPDGYTLHIGGRPNTIHKVMYPSIEYDYARDLAPVGVIGTMTPILVAGMHTPIHSVQDLVKIAKERPGELTCASTGVATTAHLLCEILKEVWDIDLTHIPYRGSAAAITDMIGGQTDVQITVVASTLPYIKTGKLRPLATFGSARLPTLPDVPTLRELGVPVQDYRIWTALLVPTGTPPQIIERLNQSLNTALNNPKMVETMLQNGMDPATAPNSPAELKNLIASETELWTGILRKHGIGQADAGGGREGPADQTGTGGNRAN